MYQCSRAADVIALGPGRPEMLAVGLPVSNSAKETPLQCIADYAGCVVSIPAICGSLVLLYTGQQQAGGKTSRLTPSLG